VSRPRFLADEDLRRSIVQAVRRLEPAIEITSVFDEGLSGTSDVELLQVAWDQEWLVVSHDVNTMKSDAENRIATGGEIHGLFLIAQKTGTKPAAESLALIWAASEFEEWRNRIIYLPL
jgi:hypothetical protein